MDFITAQDNALAQVYFTCNKAGIYVVETNYKNVGIDYQYRSNHLPQWREIHNKVIKLVDPFLVSKES
jgi:Zn-dependent peptidase ImmA (M78 family)